MQVYRDLEVLTARPGEADTALVRHELYGVIGAGDAYSVGRYVADAAVHYKAAREAGAVAIFVGGTGLYFRGLLEGLSPVPAIDALRVRDGEMARRLNPTDVQRLVRALEVIEGTGRSLDFWQRQPGTPVVAEQDTVKLVAGVDRAELYRRSDDRFRAMVKGGALFEVARLKAMHLDPGLPIMRALGVRPLIAYIEGQCGLEEATVRAQTDTRHYIKRQLTWLRRNMIAWKAINLFDMKRNLALDDIFN